MITIENEQCSAAIAPLGAELRSFKQKATGREIMWSGDPAVWAGTAPILFPVVGKSVNGQTRIQGQTYAMPKHGFVRTRTAEVVQHESDRATLAFSADPETQAHYPFDFRLEVEFHLSEDQLHVNYRVFNRGKETMPFTLGSHPAFALDLETAALDDYFIEFDQPETLDLYGLKDGFFEMKQAGHLNHETKIPLSAKIFDNDALIFTQIQSRVARLKCTHTASYLEMDLGGMPHLGLWAKPGAAYVCIEPWLSHDDAADGDGIFENKPGIQHLDAGAYFETRYGLRVVDPPAVGSSA